MKLASYFNAKLRLAGVAYQVVIGLLGGGGEERGGEVKAE